MTAHEATSSLSAWRKKVTGSKRETLSIEDWESVMKICIEANLNDDEPTIDLASLLLGILKRLADDSPNNSALAELVHSLLVPSLRQVEPGQTSLARTIIAALQSSFKPLSKKASECCFALTQLASKLPEPSASTSTSEKDPWLVPLFTYIMQQGLDQRWTLLALDNLVGAVPLEELPGSLLETLMEDMDMSENIALRASLIRHILYHEWCYETLGTTGTAKEFRRIVLDPIARLFDPSSGSPKQWQNVQRYLYPQLMTMDGIIQGSMPEIILDYLDPMWDEKDVAPARRAKFSSQDAGLECWTAITAAAIQSRRMGIKDVDNVNLRVASEHANSNVRLKAFQIATQNDDLLCGDERIGATIARLYIRNGELHGTGERSEYLSAITQFLKYLDQELKIAHKAVQRVKEGYSPIQGITVQQIKEKPPRHRLAIHVNPAQAMAIGEGLKTDVLDYVQTRMFRSRRQPVSCVLVTLMMMKAYLDVFQDTPGTQEAVLTKQTVVNLLSCQASEFTEVRRRARDILDSSTIDLPGYGPGDWENIDRLYTAGTKAAEHTRRTQADAGRSAICLWFTRFNRNHDNDEEDISRMTDRLEEFVYECELDLVTGMTYTPLHGHLAVLRDIVLCLKFGTTHSLKEFEQIFRRLWAVVERVWDLTRPVISLKRSDDPDKRPDHEIARAYEVTNITDTGHEDDDDNDEASNVTDLLSGCWRATVGAGELLTAIISITMPTFESPDAFWSREDVNAAGQQYLTWMHEIRHRGTFSKLAISFADLVQSVKKVPSLASLPLNWLDAELAVVTKGDLSTTRRSAALPYSILAIVTGDPEWTDKANTSLLKLADINWHTSDETKIHAFNVLQVELTDAKQAKFLDRYFERAVMTAIAAFQSANWNVRNVGLILFSTLIHRSLNLGNSQDLFVYQKTAASRQTYAAWHAKYPSILPYVTKFLADYDLSVRASQHSPLFPMLIIIRSLRVSENGHEVQRPLVPAVERFLCSREWQVRKVAAQALTSLHSHRDALERVRTWTIDAPGGSNNLIHGRYHLLANLIDEVIDFTRVDNDTVKLIGSNLLAALREHYHSPLVDIRSIVLHCVSVFLRETKYAILVPRSDLVEFARKAAEEVLRPATETGKPIHSLSMFLHVLHLVSANVRTHTLLKMLEPTNTSPEVQQLPALWVLCGLFDNGNIDFEEHPQLLDAVIRLIRSPTQDTAVRTSALDALHTFPFDGGAVMDLAAPVKHALARELLMLVQRTKYVPIREAALPALAQVVDWIACDSNDLSGFPLLSEVLLQNSHEDQSLPTREAALKAMRIIPRWLFPDPETEGDRLLSQPKSLLTLHKTVFRLLNDDDADIRAGAAEVAIKALDAALTYCQSSTVTMWQQSVFALILEQLKPEDAAPWKEWFIELVIDQEGAKADFKLAFESVPSDKVLFEVEPPNLFRDSLEIAKFMTVVLCDAELSLAQWTPDLLLMLDFFENRPAREPGADPFPCPIEDRYEGIRRVVERKGLIKRLYDQQVRMRNAQM